jgi:DNA-binding NarL/FixJ family response regulator
VLLKLLIAEDQPALRRVIRIVVGELVGEIRDCVSAGDLEQAYATWEPDFVLIDAEMKALDALAAMRSIRAANPSAKVIILSSYDSAEMREATLNAGALACVAKENLLEISRLLESHR